MIPSTHSQVNLLLVFNAGEIAHSPSNLLDVLVYGAVFNQCEQRMIQGSGSDYKSKHMTKQRDSAAKGDSLILQGVIWSFMLRGL